MGPYKPKDKLFGNWRSEVLSSVCYMVVLYAVWIPVECKSNGKLVLLTRAEILDTSQSCLDVSEDLRAAQENRQHSADSSQFW